MVQSYYTIVSPSLCDLAIEITKSQHNLPFEDKYEVDFHYDVVSSCGPGYKFENPQVLMELSLSLQLEAIYHLRALGEARLPPQRCMVPLMQSHHHHHQRTWAIRP